MGVQTPLREIIKKLKTWQSNPTWSAGKAAKELNTKKPTILAWKKKYWADLDRITDPGDRMRQPGAAVQAATYNYVTKPRQVNASDCALYVLHYMRATHKFVTKRRPSSLLEYMPSLVQSRYNVSKAAASRKAIRARLTRLQQQNS
ncbi:hypothetical protein PHMEG_00019131 [Phytophthora megakarya]|uniref:Ubiquitin-like protease family profile domain-containing protein n=1 Tax=Phytophthora megakarya TaxID=4795 RepID=A0A225VS21_9STRA|nr:hypothetical protein PHMEG_00019131 [Phytophthora megakarya]